MGDIREARKRDAEQKNSMKKYNNKGRYIRPHNIKVGDTVLREQKITKGQPPYDPQHCTVIKVRGTQVQVNKRGR